LADLSSVSDILNLRVEKEIKLRPHRRGFFFWRENMQQDENQQANFEDEQTDRGGSAPEHRRCRYTKADGKGCRDWAVRGHELCYRHGVFLRAGRGIDVPLLEDEASIVLVLSETLRAVAQGTIALKSGSLLLEGCRLAHTMHMEKQKAANAERKRRRTGVREDELGEETQEPGAGSQEDEAGGQEPGSGTQERVPHICPGLADVGEHDPILAGTEPCAPRSEPCEGSCALSSEPCGGVLAAQAEPLEGLTGDGSISSRN
jgi:hypothetical protein